MGDFGDLDIPTLLDRAASLALADPRPDDEERWAVVVELHRRGDARGHDVATAWCGSTHPLLRSLGADADERAAEAILDELQRADGSELAVDAATEMPRDMFVPRLEALYASAPHLERVVWALHECRRSGPVCNGRAAEEGD